MIDPPRVERHSAQRPERRAFSDRRRRHWWSVWYGSFHPRRRVPARRLDEHRFQAVDWYAARLLVLALGIALLSVTDAFLTLQLLNAGASEINPVMEALLFRGVAAFTVGKIGITCLCVVALVFVSSHRFLRIVRVEAMMYMVLVGYAALIGYEIWLLNGTGNIFSL